MQSDAIAEMRDALEVFGAGPAHDAVNFVPLVEEQLGEIAAVLPGDASDERPFHEWSRKIFLTPGHSCPWLGYPVGNRPGCQVRHGEPAGDQTMTAVRDKRVLITGAGRGLGRELVRRFVAAGAEVIATDRDETALAETVRTVGGAVFGYL